MTKFTNKRFSVSGGKKYMDNWEATFGKDKDEENVPPLPTLPESAEPGAEPTD